MERMFDNHSFTDEITNASEAKSCYKYFAHNVSKFRQELAEEGLSYDEIEKEVRQCWINLLNSCHRVGFMNGHLERIAKHYGVGINKAIKKK